MQECKDCKQTITQDISALGHDFGEWEIVTEPTATTAGEKQRTCTRCKKTETESIFLKNSSAEGGQ